MDEANRQSDGSLRGGETIRDNILVICHGGVFDEPENVGRAGADTEHRGRRFAASSGGCPLNAPARQVEEFKALAGVTASPVVMGQDDLITP